MIDLRKTALPDTITVKGRAFRIYTDYRVWLDFGVKFKDPGCSLRDLLFVFVDEIPCCNFLPELIEFYSNPNSTPKSINGDSDDGTVSLDYIEDGAYIYASFLPDYGIDLLDTDMHWWKFTALFNSLSEDPKIKTIMGYRAYKKPPKNYNMNTENEKLKKAWSLGQEFTEEEMNALEEFNNL